VPVIDTVISFAVVIAVVASISGVCIVGLLLGFFILYKRLSRAAHQSRPDSEAANVEMKPVKMLSGVTVLEKIGQGNFSIVYKGLWDGSPVALKLLKADEMDDFEREVSLLR
jgi:hypothetical protein